MSTPLVIYGAYGYTGTITAKLAKSRGLNAVLSGRNSDRLQALADDVGLPQCAVSLDDAEQLDSILKDATVVLHCAGPFSHTAKAMIDACIRTQTHYLDITGEIQVFEAAAARSDEAKAAGIMLMPGAGFDVVPSDCLAAHLSQRLPGATQLDLAFMGIGAGVSHGTATTMAENIHRGSAIRKNGRLHPVPTGSITRQIDFGRGERLAMAIPWGDVSTAGHTTGIPNIRVFVPVPRSAQIMARMSNGLGWFLGSGPVQSFLKSQIKKRPAGPSDAQRANARTILWGEATNDEGETVVTRLETPEGYTVTAIASLDIAEKVLAGNAPVGYQTPASAYGSDLIMGIEGVSREDVI